MRQRSRPFGHLRCRAVGPGYALGIWTHFLVNGRLWQVLPRKYPASGSVTGDPLRSGIEP